MKQLKLLVFIKILGQLDNLVKDKAFVLFKLKNIYESILICKKNWQKNNDVNILNILGLNFFGLRDISRHHSKF